MPLESFLVGFALAAGAASFFSPCSVGLFPAYVGYYLGRGPNFRPIGDGGAMGTSVVTGVTALSTIVIVDQNGAIAFRQSDPTYDQMAHVLRNLGV